MVKCGLVGSGYDWRCRRSLSWWGKAGYGSTKHGRRGVVMKGVSRPGQAVFGRDRHGMAQHDKAGSSMLGASWCGPARHVVAWQARCNDVGYIVATSDKARQAKLG